MAITTPLAWEIPGFSFSLPANADYSAEGTYQFTPVTAVASTGTGINTPTALAPVASTGDPIIGILQNNPTLGEGGTVVTNGISIVLAKDVFAIGDKLMACPSGGVLKATSGNYQIGLALGVGAAATYVPVLLINLGKA